MTEEAAAFGKFAETVELGRQVPIVVAPEKWKTIPGASGYQLSTLGGFRSVDRVKAGRNLKGKVLATRLNNSGYVLINYVTDEGVKVTRTLHTVMLETFDKRCPPGMEACHLDDDPLRNVWAPGTTEDEIKANGGNLMWNTRERNIWQRTQNSPAQPKPERHCIRCGQVVHAGGRRCHDCVVDIGERAAQLLEGGYTLAEVCEALDYPSAEGVHKLAVKYGALTQRVDPEPPPRWSQRVNGIFVTLRDRFGRTGRR